MLSLVIIVMKGESFLAALGGGNYLILSLIRSFTIASVDIFILITGFFMCKNDKRTIGKPLSLLIQVTFFSVLIYLILCVFTVESFSIKVLIRRLIPANWFITLYIVLYLISPYINTVVVRFSKREWSSFLIIILVLFSIAPMFLGISESVGLPLKALSTIGNAGNAAGYSIINFITLYCIGAYIRLMTVHEKFSLKTSIIIAVACALLLWGLRFLPIHSTPWHIAGWYDNILVILLASSLFLTFKKIHFSSKVVNYIAKAAITVYIIHYSLFKLVDPSKTLQLPIYGALLHIFAFIIVVFVISIVLNFIYNTLSKKTIDRFDMYRIPYYDKEN